MALDETISASSLPYERNSKNSFMNILKRFFRPRANQMQEGAAQIRPTATRTVAAPDAEDGQKNLDGAITCLQRGDLAGAESILGPMLLRQSDHPDVLHLLGVVKAQRGKFSEAETLIRQSLEINPDNPVALLNHGNALKALARYQEALASYDRALVLDPDNAAALNNRGAVLVDLGNQDEAMSSYDKSLAIAPDHIDAMLNRSILLLVMKRPGDALTGLERVLAADANHIVAMHHRGLALAALTRNQEALTQLEHLLERNPAHVEALTHRSGILVALGQREEALASCERALAVNPGHAEAHLNRGNIFLSLARNEEALASFDAAIACKEGYREAQLRRCAVLTVLKRFDESLKGYDDLLEVTPEDLEALFNRSVLLVELKRFSDAISGYDAALHVKADFVEALNNRGIAQWHAGQDGDALESYDRAIALRPDYADAFFNRGVVLSRMGRRAEALASYDRAVVFNAEYAVAYNNRGVLLSDLKRYEDALASFDRALAISPDFVDALANRGGIFRVMSLYERAAQDYARVIELNPDYDYALGNKLNSDLHTCNWRDYGALQERIFEAVRSGKRASLPFSFLVMSDSGAEQLQCAQTYSSHKFPGSGKPIWQGERYQHQKIRLAYLSADFHGHATAYLMVELFEKHDRERFEVSAWSFGPEATDDMRKRLQQAFDQFNNVRGMSDAEVAAALRAGEIDIAVDLKGYTRDSRTGIFSFRAAPIQVSYLVYPGTMGANYIDYIVADSTVIPRGHEPYYAEKVVRLPDSYQVNDSKRAISVQASERSACGLPGRGFVFCCFNKNYKIAPNVFDIWMRLLRTVDGSVLWLFEDNAAAMRNLRMEAESRGVSASRLVFAGHMPLERHLARHRLADLFLDTLPCNAHTTASDALWAGLPVLTCIGNSFPGRVAASLLRAVGLADLITENLVDYEALALKLATTPGLLAEYRSRLEANKSQFPLFNIDRSRRHIESAYIAMHARHMRGEPPAGFDVQPVVVQ